VENDPLRPSFSEGLAEMSELFQADLQWLVDRLKIRDCLHRYTRGLDRHDAELIAGAFWPDALISYGDHFEGALEPFVEWSNRLHAERWEAHSHNVTNQSVEFEGDQAHAESYVLYFHRGADNDVDVGVGRYLDLFVRRSGEWRILKRQFIADMLFRANGASSGKSGFVPPGRRDRKDPSYQRPLTLHRHSD
jgi:hypothetical protein